MAREISETEWKLFKAVRLKALERFCERVLVDIARVLADTDKSFHERYLAISKLIDQRDEEMASGFNDLRRSTALRILSYLHYLELLTDEDLECFSPETRDVVEFLANNYRR